MMILKSLGLITLAVLPLFAHAYTDLDASQFESIVLTPAETEQIYAINYREYFETSCKHKIVLNLEPLSDDPLTQMNFKKAVEAKGHLAMLSPYDNAFPPKTIYFTGVDMGVREIGKTKPQYLESNVNKASMLDEKDRPQTAQEFEKFLFSDEKIRDRRFQVVAGVNVQYKTYTIPQAQLEFEKANRAELIQDAGGCDDCIESGLPKDELVGERIKRFATHRMSGLELKALQLKEIQKLIAQSDEVTLFDFSSALMFSPYDKSMKTAYQAIVDGLPNCRQHR